jgi:hypothetical protein
VCLGWGVEVTGCVCALSLPRLVEASSREGEEGTGACEVGGRVRVGKGARVGALARGGLSVQAGGRVGGR